MVRLATLFLRFWTLPLWMILPPITPANISDLPYLYLIMIKLNENRGFDALLLTSSFLHQIYNLLHKVTIGVSFMLLTKYRTYENS